MPNCGVAGLLWIKWWQLTRLHFLNWKFTMGIHEGKKKQINCCNAHPCEKKKIALICMDVCSLQNKNVDIYARYTFPLNYPQFPVNFHETFPIWKSQITLFATPQMSCCCRLVGIKFLTFFPWKRKWEAVFWLKGQFGVLRRCSSTGHEKQMALGISRSRWVQYSLYYPPYTNKTASQMDIYQ